MEPDFTKRSITLKLTFESKDKQPISEIDTQQFIKALVHKGQAVSVHSLKGMRVFDVVAVEEESLPF